jgi:hypothetical protein
MRPVYVILDAKTGMQKRFATLEEEQIWHSATRRLVKDSQGFYRADPPIRISETESLDIYMGPGIRF